MVQPIKVIDDAQSTDQSRREQQREKTANRDGEGYTEPAHHGNADRHTGDECKEDGDSAQPWLWCHMEVMPRKVSTHQPGGGPCLLADAPGQQQTKQQTATKDDAVRKHHDSLP